MLLTLVSSQDGAEMFISIEDITPLTEIAASNPIVFDILRHAWLGSMSTTESKFELAQNINKNLQAMTITFKGTDAVTLLSFVGALLPEADPAVCIQLRDSMIETNVDVRSWRIIQSGYRLQQNISKT